MRYVAFIFLCFFIEEALPECENSMKVSVKRTVYKQGFHREIETNVLWFVKNHSSRPDCDLLLFQNIPREMFIDLDEVKLRDSDKTRVVPLGNKLSFNVEYPAHLSTAQNVLVYMNSNIKESSEIREWEITSSSILPVHWRYQQPTEQRYYINISLPMSIVFVKCEDNFTLEIMKHCNLKSMTYPCSYHEHDKKCNWYILRQKEIDKNDEIVFSVPVGAKKHTILVTCVTISATLAACYVLMKLTFL